MNQRVFLKLLLAAALLRASTVLAHAGHEDIAAQYRSWSDSRGDFHLDAAFVLERDGTVLLRKQDDSLVRVDVEELSDSDRDWVAERVAHIQALNTVQTVAIGAPDKVDAAADTGAKSVPVPVRFFESFVPHVSLSWDDTHLVVESDGMPEHPMMVGIRAWNQQVPLPQSYRGNNAFHIPLKPQVAASSTPAPYLSAIAVAVNGVPIFHPIKQDGRTDTVANGELDEYGGHAGRADDYHYHIAPRHLEKIVGVGNPVAYSLDGYPIVVAKEEEGRPVLTLDENHGHLDDSGNYKYYSTTAFPYLNISYRGIVDLENRPRAIGVRPYTQPLRGATITGFEKISESSYRLSYEVSGAKGAIAYNVGNDGTQFLFTGTEGGSTSATYPPASERSKGEGRGGKRGEAARGDGARPESGEVPPQGAPRGPSPSTDGAPRQPWILAHASELDENQDGAIALDELTREVNRAFDGYDANKDGSLDSVELGGKSNVRSAMGGFIKGHAKEVNQDGNGGLTREELMSTAQRMFKRIDRDNDGTATAAELQASKREPGQEAGTREGNQNGGARRTQKGE